MSLTPPRAEAARQYYRVGDFSRAEHACRTALLSTPDHVPTLHLLGLIRHRLGRHDEGLVYLRRAVNLLPVNPDLHNDLGIVALAAGRHDEALAHYREALRLRPDWAGTHNNIALLLVEFGRTAEAISHWREALRLQPEQAALHNNLGVVLSNPDISWVLGARQFRNPAPGIGPLRLCGGARSRPCRIAPPFPHAGQGVTAADLCRAQPVPAGASAVAGPRKRRSTVANNARSGKPLARRT